MWIVLPAVSPFHQPPNEDNDKDIRFAVSELATFTKATFRHFDIDVKWWALNQTADNTHLNPALAKAMRIQQVGCQSHKLNLDTNEMTKLDKVLEDPHANIFEVMMESRKSLKIAAILRCQTDPVPSLPVKKNGVADTTCFKNVNSCTRLSKRLPMKKVPVLACEARSSGVLLIRDLSRSKTRKSDISMMSCCSFNTGEKVQL